MSDRVNKRNNRNLKTLESNFEEFVIKFHRMIINAIRNEAFKFNFNLSQVEVLHYVIEKKDPTMKDIAEHLDIKPPSVTPIIEFLFEKKLLKKVVDKNDNRITRIKITNKACRMFYKFKNKKILVIKKIFSNLNREDRNELVRILSLLNKLQK